MYSAWVGLGISSGGAGLSVPAAQLVGMQDEVLGGEEKDLWLAGIEVPVLHRTGHVECPVDADVLWGTLTGDCDGFAFGSMEVSTDENNPEALPASFAELMDADHPFRLTHRRGQYPDGSSFTSWSVALSHDALKRDGVLQVTEAHVYSPAPVPEHLIVQVGTGEVGTAELHRLLDEGLMCQMACVGESGADMFVDVIHSMHGFGLTVDVYSPAECSCSISGVSGRLQSSKCSH